MQIDIEQLSKRYRGGHYALRDVDLTIGSGMFGLLGPNGAGKTTLIRILVTLLAPTSGRVSIDGLDLRRDRDRIRRMVGYLPQEFSQFPKLATWEFLDYCAALGGLKRKSSRRERVDELLHDVGLFDARDRQASKLSGGMKRRLGIAQTLVNNPSIMVVDEPTVGLDPRERIRFRNLLARLAEGRVVLFSTHVVEDVEVACDRVIVFARGSMVFDGLPADLADEAQGRVWVARLDDERAAALPEGTLIVDQVPEADGTQRTRMLAERQPYESATSVAPTLEDGYLWLVGEGVAV